MTDIDIVIILDEYIEEYAWISTLLSNLENSLSGYTVRYGYVGFGENTNGIYQSTGLSSGVWGTYSDIVNIIGNFPENRIGLLPDGYSALEIATSNYTFASGGIKCFILITDRTLLIDDSDLFDSRYLSLKNYISTNDVIFHPIVESNLYGPNDENSFGIDFSGRSLQLDPDNDYAVSSEIVNIADDFYSVFVERENNIADYYIKLAVSVTEGCAWDIYQGETYIDNFSEAFDYMFLNLVEIIECDLSFDNATDAFYCSSVDEINSQAIEFNFSNSSLSSYDYHFRVTFYTNIMKDEVIYSSFTQLNSKNWFIDGEPFSEDGEEILALGEKNIKYIPDILPINLFSKQLEMDVTGVDTESQLLCGIKYYIDVEYYNVDLGVMQTLTSREYIYLCSDVDDHIWRADLDAMNWECSGQGKTDLLVSKSGDECLNPSVSSNIFGYFNISYDSRRSKSNVILNSFWDSNNDILFSAGQGYYENIGPLSGHKPDVITDQAQNFYISSFSNPDYGSDEDSGIYSYNVSLENIPEDSSASDVFNSECYPGYGEMLKEDLDNIELRLYEEDKSGSIVVNRDSVLSVVEKTNIRLDFCNIYGAYAVRLRNQNGDWGDWILINNASSYTDGGSYFIDNNRFIVPIEISRINGIRKICAEVLTFYGATSVICLDIFVNIDIVVYDVEFYTEDSLEESSKTRVYKGNSILTLNKEITDGTTEEEDPTTIYLKVIFNEEQNYSSLKFDVIHQGRADIYGEDLVPIDGDTLEDLTGDISTRYYKGSFQIYKHDGIFNKDGLGFIKIIFEESTSETCVSDTNDYFNQMLTTSELLTVADNDPEIAFSQYQTNVVPKLLSVNEFKNYYNENDTDFLFGNPDFFRD